MLHKASILRLSHFVRNALINRCSSSANVSWKITKLSHRSLVRVRGSETLKFLQGLVTNDMRSLRIPESQQISSVFCMMLNTQGRLLYDLLIYSVGDDDVFIECDRSISADFIKQLTLYRLRRKLEFLNYEKELGVFAAFPSDVPSTSSFDPQMPRMLRELKDNVYISVDPRLKQIGCRVLIPTGVSSANSVDASEASEDDYHQLRYSLGIGEGCGDMPPGASFPLEANGDYLNGINFNKGCYIGQELTARTHHTGVVRKRLMPLTLEGDTTPIDALSSVRINAKVIDERGTNVGKFRRAVRNAGLGLLYVEPALASRKLFVQADDNVTIECKTKRPFWWEAVGNLQTDQSNSSTQSTSTISTTG